MPPLSRRALSLVTLGALTLSLAGPVRAVGQEPSDADASAPLPSALDLFPRSANPDDPLGLPDDLPPPRAPAPEAPPATRPPESQVGAVLAGIPGTGERRHTLTLTITPARLTAVETVELENRSRFTAEVATHLQAPAEARVVGFARCAADAADAADAAGDECVDGHPRARETYVRARDEHGAREGRSDDDAVDPPRALEGGRARRSPRPAADAALAPAELARHHERWLARAAVPPDGRAVLVIRWELPTTMHAGVVRATLPARGSDGRAATLRLDWDAPALIGLALNGRPEDARGQRQIEPWDGLQIVAHLPSGSPTVVEQRSFPCGAGERCLEVVGYAGPATREPLGGTRVWLLLDASPSMQGPARGLLRDALRALLAQFNPTSEVRVAAFGARPGDVTRGAPAELDVAALVASSQHDLGPASRWYAPLLERPRDELRAATIVVVGDGGASQDPAGAAMVRRLERLGATLHAVVLGAGVDGEARGVGPELAEATAQTGGRVAWVRAEGASAERSARADEAIARLAAPRVRRLGWIASESEHRELGPLLAGELVHAEIRGRSVRASVGGRVVERSAEYDELASSTEAWAVVQASPARRGRTTPERADMPSRAAPAEHAEICRAPNPDSPDGVVPALALRCAEPDAPRARPRDDGIVAETLLAHLRTRLVPPARRCLRRDRAGRADYSVSATYTLQLEDSEIRGFAVEGDIAAPLRACLEDTVQRLDLPRFTRRYVVRYPIHTERSEDAPAVVLDDRAESMLDDTLRAARVERVESPPR